MSMNGNNTEHIRCHLFQNTRKILHPEKHDYFRLCRVCRNNLEETKKERVQRKGPMSNEEELLLKEQAYQNCQFSTRDRQDSQKILKEEDQRKSRIIYFKQTQRQNLFNAQRPNFNHNSITLKGSSFPCSFGRRQQAESNHNYEKGEEGYDVYQK